MMFFRNRADSLSAVLALGLLTACTQSFSNGVLTPQPDKDGSLIGYVDEKGGYRIPALFSTASVFGGSVATVTFPMKTGVFLIDRSGGEIKEVDFYIDEPISEGLTLATHEKTGLNGFLDPFGNVVIGFKYKHALSFSEGLTRVKFRGGWWVLNQKGDLVFQSKYGMPLKFSKGHAPVLNENGKWGYMNKEGKLVVAQIYDWVEKEVVGDAVTVIQNGVKSRVKLLK